VQREGAKAYSALSNAWHKNQGIFNFFYVSFALLLGSPISFIFNILFLYLFFSTVVIKFIGTYIVYYVFIYIMVMISPIFVPMVLFKKTEDMFYSWLRITLSFALQPAIIATFITMMLSIYDSALYGDCVFFKLSDNPASFGISDPGSNCSGTYGYQLYKLYTTPTSWSKQASSFFQLPLITAEANFIPAAFQALLISFIIYKMTLRAVDFAASITGGIMIELNQDTQNKPKDKEKGAKDKVSSGSGGGAADKASKG
jgi:type IV secretion system protein VirB6